MANGKISYTVRDYQGIRTELLNYVKSYYPDLIQDYREIVVLDFVLGKLAYLYLPLFRIC